MTTATHPDEHSDVPLPSIAPLELTDASDARNRTLAILKELGLPAESHGSGSIVYPDNFPAEDADLLHHILAITEARFHF